MRSVFLVTCSCLVLLLCFEGCKPEECEGGSGGSVNVVARLYHHDRLIANDSSHPDTVYVAYNTHESPGSDLSSYDAVFIGTKGEDHVNVTGLKCGEYYFFATGLDTVSSPGAKFRVTGGIPFSTERESGEIIFTLPVAE
jgi:hypothetical protein